jgi:hypothetical protein
MDRDVSTQTIPGPLHLAILGARAAGAELEAWIRGIPGHRFGSFGRALGIRALIGGEPLYGGALVLTPVNALRYWEFDFADRALQEQSGRALDVSSPRLLSLYFAHRARFGHIQIANPDLADLQITVRLARAGGIRRISLTHGGVDAAILPGVRHSAIWSISVVEHIAGEQGDSTAIRTMFDALEPGGTLVVTVPVDRRYWHEHRAADTYRLGQKPNESGSYFFQRFYDRAALEERLLRAVGVEPSITEWFGETAPGVFHGYIHDWQRRGFSATVRDPAFLARNFRTYGSWEEMPGVGVCGMAFRAPGALSPDRARLASHE